MIDRAPTVTVLMSVYNGEAYLHEAVESVLNQTWDEFEFLIVDDGSTDKSAEILRSYQDQRIRIITNTKNMGLASALNQGLDSAKGEFIARMDADDVSTPDRLSTQIQFMCEHPNVDVCGSWVLTIGDPHGHLWRYPTDDETIRSKFLFECSLAHPSVMLRASKFRRYGLRYDHSFRYTQDYELWARCGTEISFANIPRPLLLHRLHGKGAGEFHRQEQEAAAMRVRCRLLAQIGVNPTENELRIHEALCAYRMPQDRDAMAGIERWLKKIRAANAGKRYFSEPAFNTIIADRWLHICRKQYSSRASAWKAVLSSELGRPMWRVAIVTLVGRVSRCGRVKSR